MDDETESSPGEAEDLAHPEPERRKLPPPSDAERAFWRRAVALERARISPAGWAAGQPRRAPPS